MSCLCGRTAKRWLVPWHGVWHWAMELHARAAQQNYLSRAFISHLLASCSCVLKVPLCPSWFNVILAVASCGSHFFIVLMAWCLKSALVDLCVCSEVSLRHLWNLWGQEWSKHGAETWARECGGPREGLCKAGVWLTLLNGGVQKWPLLKIRKWTLCCMKLCYRAWHHMTRIWTQPSEKSLLRSCPQYPFHTLCWGAAVGRGLTRLSQWGQSSTLSCYADSRRSWFKTCNLIWANEHEGRSLAECVAPNYCSHTIKEAEAPGMKLEAQKVGRMWEQWCHCVSY